VLKGKASMLSKGHFPSTVPNTFPLPSFPRVKVISSWTTRRYRRFPFFDRPDLSRHTSSLLLSYFLLSFSHIPPLLQLEEGLAPDQSLDDSQRSARSFMEVSLHPKLRKKFSYQPLGGRGEARLRPWVFFSPALCRPQ